MVRIKMFARRSVPNCVGQTVGQVHSSACASHDTSTVKCISIAFNDHHHHMSSSSFHHHRHSFFHHHRSFVLSSSSLFVLSFIIIIIRLIPPRVSAHKCIYSKGGHMMSMYAQSNGCQWPGHARKVQCGAQPQWGHHHCIQIS